MSKNEKKLLNEGTIRRFMKLAEIDTLSDQFVDTLTEKYEEENLEEGGMPYARDDEEVGADAPFDQDVEPAEALPPEPDVAPEEPLGAAVDAEAIFTDLAQALADVAQEHGVTMDIEGGEEGPLEDPVEDPDALDMAPEEEEVPGVELEDEVDEDAMVAEITRRVTARLMKESRNERVAGELADKIMERLRETPQK